jgi:hypothetical protein
VAASHTAHRDRLITGAAALALGLVLASASRHGLAVGALAVVLLGAGLATRDARALTGALMVLILGWALGLHGSLDGWAGVRVGALILLGELSWWCVEVPEGSAVDAGLAVARLAAASTLCVLGVALSSISLLVAASISELGLTWRIAAVASAGAALMLAVPELRRSQVECGVSDEARSDRGSAPLMASTEFPTSEARHEPHR